MKVLYVSPYPPARDGIGDYTWMIANGVRHAGNETRIVVPYVGHGAPPEVIGDVKPDGQAYKRMKRAVEEWQPDVIHVQFAIAAFGPRTLALLRWLDAIRRDFNTPVVVTLHEVSRETALLRALGEAVHRRIVRRCDQVIVHSEASRGALIAETGLPDSKISIIPHPSAQPWPASSTGDELRVRFGLGDARILLAFGFIHVDKGLDDLIQALTLAHKDIAGGLSNVRVVIAGDVRPRRGAFRALEIRDRLYRGKLVRLIAVNGLRGLVIMTGYVPDGDVASWFGIADAVVLPYRRAAQSGVESLARAFGVPVVGSAVGGLGEQLAGSQWTFPPRAPDHIARTITDFLAVTVPGAAHLRPPDGADLEAVTAATVGLYGALASGSPSRATRVA